MRSVIFLILGSLATAQAWALEPSTLILKADTDYKQVVWTAVKLPRVYSANVLPANPQAAEALNRLSHRSSYSCKAEAYFGSVGYFNQQGEKPVIMLYSLTDCKTQ